MGNKSVKIIGDKKVFAESKQDEPVAKCESCEWERRGNNASGTGVRHAAAKRHTVLVTKLIVTRYDGTTPDAYAELGIPDPGSEPQEEPGVDTQAPAVVE